LNYDDLERELNASLDEIKDNCSYLLQRKFIQGIYSGGIRGVIFIITNEGINFLEKSQQAKQNLSQQVVSVTAPNFGNITVSQGNNNVITPFMQITNAFDNAYSKLNANSQLSLTQQVEVRQVLRELKEELDKGDNANKGKLHEGLKWLKDHVLDIATLVEPFVLKAIGA
jgi:hypothetical protein